MATIMTGGGGVQDSLTAMNDQITLSRQQQDARMDRLEARLEALHTKMDTLQAETEAIRGDVTAAIEGITVEQPQEALNSFAVELNMTVAKLDDVESSIQLLRDLVERLFDTEGNPL